MKSAAGIAELLRLMRALIQRVSEATVRVDGEVVGQIQRGLLIFLGVAVSDTVKDADFLIRKVLHMRIFPDAAGKMNHNVQEIEGDLLVVSQFTLYGDTTKGNRPSYSHAATPEIARVLYDHFVRKCTQSGLLTQSGVFQARMNVHLVNDGPVTFLCHSGHAARQV